MGKRHQVQMLLHGAIVLFIGLLFGLPFAALLAAGGGDESMRTWRVAHSGIVAVGLMLIVIGVALRYLVIGHRGASWLVWSLVTSAYGFILALLVGRVAWVTGHQLLAPILKLVAFASSIVGVLGSLIGVALTVCGAYGALRGSPAD